MSPTQDSTIKFIFGKIRFFRILLGLAFGLLICYLAIGWMASSRVLYPEPRGLSIFQQRYLDDPTTFGMKIEQKTVLNTPIYLITKGAEQEFKPALEIKRRLTKELSISSKKGTVVMLHGRRACKEFMLPIVARLIELDYRFVLIDLPAHGENDENYAGYGSHEAQLALDIFKALEKELQFPEEEPEILLGFSMGGAIALKSAAEHSEWDGVISLSTFADFESVARHQLKGGSEFVKDLGILATRHATYLRTGIETNKLSPKTWIQGIDVPILLIHGEKDHLIPLSHAEELISHASSSQVELIKIPIAAHNDALAEGGLDLYERIAAFILSAEETEKH